MSKTNGGEQPPELVASQPVVVAQMVLDPGRQSMTIHPGPMVGDVVLFYTNLAAVASRKAMELLMAERAQAETRKKPQIITPSTWPSDLKGGPRG